MQTRDQIVEPGKALYFIAKTSDSSKQGPACCCTCSFSTNIPLAVREYTLISLSLTRLTRPAPLTKSTSSAASSAVQQMKSLLVER